jgi:uncharacterized protein YdhG (YjbR/CyaY superfamily)
MDTIEKYIAALPPDRQEALSRLMEVVRQHLPEGFREEIAYRVPAFVVPHTLYPPGYHCDPKLPLPFISVASRKNYVSFYHMGLYDPALLDWYTARWQQVSNKKPDIGKCCIRFNKTADIPYGLLGELSSKITPQQWIDIYEASLKK